MKHRKTHRRRRHHSKRRTSRRLTRRNRGGSAVSKCRQYENTLSKYKDQLVQQTERTIEDFVGKVRALYDEASRADCSSDLLREIEEFENGPVLSKANSLLRV